VLLDQAGPARHLLGLFEPLCLALGKTGQIKPSDSRFVADRGCAITTVLVDQNIRNYFVGSIVKQESQRRCSKAMHAKHADNSEVNDPSGRVIGSAQGGTEVYDKDILALSVSGKPRLAIKRVAPGL
jgi:hypothetical protein